MTVPALAISVRQPWAWAIIHAGKDVENRSATAMKHIAPRLPPIGDRIAIHAAKGMTQDEYHNAASFMGGILDIICPPPHELLRGGIIGTAGIARVIRNQREAQISKWHFGTGILLADPQACDFIPVTGQLGVFPWTPIRDGAPDPAKPWMLPKPMLQLQIELLPPAGLLGLQENLADLQKQISDHFCIRNLQS